MLLTLHRTISRVRAAPRAFVQVHILLEAGRLHVMSQHPNADVGRCTEPQATRQLKRQCWRRTLAVACLALPRATQPRDWSAWITKTPVCLSPLHRRCNAVGCPACPPLTCPSHRHLCLTRPRAWSQVTSHV